MKKTVTVSFDGHNAEKIAQKFYTWILDGGHEDAIIEEMSDTQTEVSGLSDWDNETLTLVFNCKVPD